jgi:hypothetical protein
MLFERWTKRESQSIQINKINLNRLHKMLQETGAFLFYVYQQSSDCVMDI